MSDVLDFLVSGGPVMVPIGLASVVAMAALIERVVALRTPRIVPHGFGVEVIELLNQGRHPDAVTLCRKSDSAVSRIVEVAILARGRTRAEIKERLEEVGRRESAELERYSQVLGTVASVAPLLGLLGTVWGMILTFDVIIVVMAVNVWYDIKQDLPEANSTVRVIVALSSSQACSAAPAGV